MVIPLSAFEDLDATRLHSVVLTGFRGQGQIEIDDVGLVRRTTG